MRPRITLLAFVVIGCQALPEESSVEQPSIVVPSGFDFGTVQIGTASAPQTLTVSPGSNNQKDTITAVSARCPDFAINAPNLPAEVSRVCDFVSCAVEICPDMPEGYQPDSNQLQSNQRQSNQLQSNQPQSNLVCRTRQIREYKFDATFAPNVTGPVSCVVTVSETDQTTGARTDKTITLTGTGQPRPYKVDIQPTAVEFGEVRRGTNSTEAQVVVRSTGSSPLTVSSVTVSPGFTMQAVPTVGYDLAPNEAQAYPVTCRPSLVGEMSGELVVMSNDQEQPLITVPLSCKGIDSMLDITPSPAVLATTRVGESVDGTLVLRNTGTATMILQSVSLSGSGAITMLSGPQPGTQLAPTNFTTVRVRFGAAAKGDFSAALVASYDSGKRRTAQITARALATSLALTPDGEVDFGPVCVGKRKTQEFTLVANDQGWFSLGSISDPGGPFAVAPLSLPIVVLGGGGSQLRFEISAAPTGDGVMTAPVTVHTDIPRGQDHELNLSVRGLSSGIAATPDAVDLGSNPLNATTLAKPVYLSNCTGAPITFSNARIDEGDKLDFAIVQQPSMPAIAPGAVASWLIVLQAHTEGNKHSTFKVDYEGGSATIVLQGEGLDLDQPPDRGSYYACSTGRASALWPIAIALVLLLRRRRR